MYKKIKLFVILKGATLIQGAMLIVFAKCSRGYVYSGVQSINIITPFIVNCKFNIEIFPDSNHHVNNLLTSTTKDTEDWDINMTDGKWKNNQDVDNVCGPNWYGWYSDSVGTISTTLYKNDNLKCGRLDFGNCWTSGSVTVYLNGELIATANANEPSKIIEFPILTDSQLEILDEGVGSVVRFNKFEMVSCTTVSENFECPIDDPNYAFIGDTCYYFDAVPRTKLEAKENCIQNNGKIWEPNTIERINQVRSIAQEISKAKEWWVGIAGAAGEETFNYDSNDEIFPFTPNTAPWINLDGGGSTKNCVCMDNNQNSLQFYDVPCDEGRQYHSICETSSSSTGDKVVL